MSRLKTEGFQIWSQGAIAPGSLVYFYSNLTTTPADVFLNAGLSIPAPNPSQADENGFVTVYGDPATTYTVVARTPQGATIRTWDNVSGAVISTGGGGTPGTPGAPGETTFFAYNASPRNIEPPAATGDGTNDGWHFPPLDGDNWLVTKRGTDASVGTWSDPVLFTGAPGSSGVNGGSTVFIWTRATSQPALPDGPNPAGWSSNPSSAPGTGFLWQSVGQFDGSGALIGAWDNPVQVEGEDGSDGSDGSDGVNGLSPSFIFRRDASTPSTPTGLNPVGWTDGPEDGTDTLWQSYAIKSADGLTLVQPWSVPYKVTGDAGPAGNRTISRWIRSVGQPATPLGGNPAGWSTDAATATGAGFLWQANAVFDSSGSIVGSWSTPFRIEGERGARNIFIRAATNPGTPTGANPSGWSDIPPAGTAQLWQSNGSFAPDGTQLGPWSAPFVVTGEQGNQYVQLYRRAAAQPATPTGTNPTGWSATANLGGSDPIWMISGYYTAAGQLVGVWSTPARITGESGNPGIDGTYFDFRYARATSAPSVDVDNPTPPGWSDGPPVGSNILWQIIARKNADGSLITNWSPPEQITGLNGSDGAPGTPGVNAINGQIDRPAINLVDDNGTINYAGAFTQWTVRDGALDVTSSASFAVTPQAGVDASVDANGLVMINSVTNTVTNIGLTATYAGETITSTVTVTVIEGTQTPQLAIQGGNINVNNAPTSGTNEVATRTAVNGSGYAWSITGAGLSIVPANDVVSVRSTGSNGQVRSGTLTVDANGQSDSVSVQVTHGTPQ